MEKADAVPELVSTVFSPTLVLGVLFPLVGGLDVGAAGVAWGLLASLFAAVIPAAIVHRGVLSGRWTDHHLSRREQRIVPLAAAIVSVVVGLVLLALLGAPRVLVALQVAALATLVFATAVTLAWKISFHVAVITLAASALTVVGGAWWALAWLAVPAVAWARLRLAAHTVAQLAAGALLGAGVTVATLLLAGR